MSEELIDLILLSICVALGVCFTWAFFSFIYWVITTYWLIFLVTGVLAFIVVGLICFFFKDK